MKLKRSWEEIHEMGPVKYILVYGICMFGFYMFIVSNIISYFRGKLSVEDLSTSAFWIGHGVAILLGGTVYGYLTWRHHVGQIPLKSEDVDKLESMK